MDRYHFPELLASIASAEVVEFASPQRDAASSVQKLVRIALSDPLDFPAVLQAVLPDDRVALAVDPNIPEIECVLVSVIEHLGAAQPSGIDVVLADEVCDSLREAIVAAVAGKAEVHVHRSDARNELRYIGADAGAEPVYLNRFLVDADFVLPIVSNRCCAAVDEFEHAGVFPEFADSLSRRRFGFSEGTLESLSPSDHFAMTLGVQVVLSVAADPDGRVADVNVGTPLGLHEHCLTLQQADATSVVSSIIVASLDGDEQQQSWLNVARAAKTASKLLDGGGTIILWTRIRQTPERWLLNLADAADASEQIPSDSSDAEQDEDNEGHDGFPAWDNSELAARQLGGIAAEYRVLLHSDLIDEIVEAIGLGVVGSIEDLRRLTKSFATCGLLRAASLACPSFSDARLNNE